MSPQALRAYLAAEQLARAGGLVAAAESLQRTIAIDSAFGLARYRLYVVASFGGAPPGGGRFDLARTIRAALQRTGGLPQRQRDLLATVDLQQRGVVGDALRRADELGRRYPDDAEAAYAEGESYYHLGIAEQQGDTTTAIRAYRDFVALWEDADLELQPRVTAARAALSRLERTP